MSIDAIVRRELRTTKASKAAEAPTTTRILTKSAPSVESHDAEWDNMDDLMATTTEEAAPENSMKNPPSDRIEAEIAAFRRWTDFSYGMDSKGKFSALIFWASPTIQLMFPMHAEMARSHFSGVHHEATSERTFSYTGRVISDLRRSMSADAVSAHVVGAATHFIVTADEIFAPGVHQSRREAAAAN